MPTNANVYCVKQRTTMLHSPKIIHGATATVYWFIGVACKLFNIHCGKITKAFQVSINNEVEGVVRVQGEPTDRN